MSDDNNEVKEEVKEVKDKAFYKELYKDIGQGITDEQAEELERLAVKNEAFMKKLQKGIDEDLKRAGITQSEYQQWKEDNAPIIDYYAEKLREMIDNDLLKEHQAMIDGYNKLDVN